jgi:hypothetical protein
MKNLILLVLLVLVSCKKKEIKLVQENIDRTTSLDTVIVEKIVHRHQLKHDDYEQGITVYYFYNSILDSLNIDKHNFCDTTYVFSNDTNYSYLSNKNLREISFNNMYLVKNRKWHVNILKSM